MPSAAMRIIHSQDLTNFLVKPKRMRHDLMVEAHYSRAPTSTAKKFTDQPFALIAEQIGSYFPNLVACHDSMFSSQGQVSSRIITVFVVVEHRRMSGLSCEIAIASGITSVDSRSDKRTQSGALYSNPQLLFFCKFLVAYVFSLTKTRYKGVYTSKYLLAQYNFFCEFHGSSIIFLKIFFLKPPHHNVSAK